MVNWCELRGGSIQKCENICISKDVIIFLRLYRVIWVLLKNAFMKKIFLLAFLLFRCAACYAQTIATIAGTDSAGYNGDNIPALTARLDHPTFLLVDGMDNILFADTDNHRVRKISPSGIITTIAGTGSSGYNGDGILATDAKLDSPVGIAVDATGNVYIADNYNSRIRKVNGAGIISTIAGKETYGFSGDNGSATAAELDYPHGIAIDGIGNIYIADFNNDCIRKINTAGIISTIAGHGTNLPGDGGAATSANIKKPYGLAVDSEGNIYFAEWDNGRIRKITTSGIIFTVAGKLGGADTDHIPATSAKVESPAGVAVDEIGNVYFCEAYNHVVRKVTTDGIIRRIAGTGAAGYSGDGGLATDAEFRNPVGICLDNAYNIFVAEFGNSRIRRIQSIVGIENNTTNNLGFTLYPNPSTGRFNVTLSGTDGLLATLVISAAVGRIVKTMTITANVPNVITLNEPPGIYCVTAYTAQGVYNTKVVIVK
jgi:sugar lactone lactonase YvrE